MLQILNSQTTQLVLLVQNVQMEHWLKEELRGAVINIEKDVDLFLHLFKMEYKLVIKKPQD